MAMPGNPTITDLPNQGGRYLQAPIYNDQQMQVPDTLIQAGGQKLANPTQGFDPYEQYAQRLFKQDIVPGIANQFLTGGNRNSSAFQGALGAAGSDLASRLAVAKANYGMQNEQFGAQLLGQGMTPLYNQAYEKPYSASGQIGQNLTQSLPGLLSAYASAPGNNFKDKLSSLLGTGGMADTAKSVADTASTLAGGTQAVQTAKNLLTPGTTTTPGAAQVPTPPVGTPPSTTGTTVPKPNVGIEQAIAPALATAGAVVMPAVVGGLGLWIFGTILKSLYEDFTETGEYAKPTPKPVTK